MIKRIILAITILICGCSNIEPDKKEVDHYPGYHEDMEELGRIIHSLATGNPFQQAKEYGIIDKIR